MRNDLEREAAGGRAVAISTASLTKTRPQPKKSAYEFGGSTYGLGRPVRVPKPPASPCIGCGRQIVQRRGRGRRRLYCSRGCEPRRDSGRTIPSVQDLVARIELGPGGCWLWQASRRPDGYGQVWVGDKLMSAHRVFYEILVRPIPGELELDHCVNPEHLEPVSHATNLRRGVESRSREAG